MMIEQAMEMTEELILDGVVHDATALFEQYESANDAQLPRAEDACENLYATPW